MNRVNFLSMTATLLIVAVSAAEATETAEAAGIAAASWYGSAELGASVPFDEGRNPGLSAETRLILESKPESGIGFRAEGGIGWNYGTSSAEALAFDAGIAPAPAAADLPPGTDLHRTFFLDQAYARASLGPSDLSFGIVPCAWGTGYLFNPTSRTGPAAFPGDDSDTAPGTLGAVVRLSLPAGFSAEAYSLAQPRLRSVVPAVDEASIDRFPFGAKLQSRSDLIDASVSFLRELPNADAEAAYWAGADAAGFFGPVSWYAEAAIRLPGGSGTDTETEACAGFSWIVPYFEITLRTEIAWIGSGVEDPAAYDTAALLAGERVLSARRYLFAMLEKEDPEAAEWKLSGGALANLDDLSLAFLAEAAFMPALSVELSAYVRVFVADGDGEFGGKRNLGGGMELTPYRSAAGIKAKVSF
ncbi:MAG: hypothetical protein A2Z99_19960 [Treponema sp. GWB1_62_6]|nr:MAG: hypothetical protein A2001_09535 [Treponema sp. GWC1_61_84]OHE69423.1 MAG: hypothetical protein A2Z99_19960 [Treponema sp. GWB1_62_6]HCM28798.1 hypothetical protein [Treponema sp.]